MAKLRVDIGVQDRTPSPLGATERQRAIEREEHAADVIRFRQAATMGIVAWLGFCLVDVVVDRELHVGRAGYFAALRMIELLILIPAILIVRRQPPPSRGLLRAMDLAGFTVATAIVSVMCLSLGGLSSHYGAGVSLVLVCRTIMSNEPWRRGLVMNGVPALSYPAVLLGAAPFDPRIAAQLHDPRETTIFGLNLTFLLATYASMVFSGHMTWSLRRQIFETRSIGKYKLKQRLGQGAMGEVWLAYHASIKRDVAIKILRPDTSKDVGAVSRFEREVRATAELTHPNTVRVFDYGVTEDGLWYYAMEALVGETLGALVAREGPLPPARAVHFVGQAARARRGARARDHPPRHQAREPLRRVARR